jgi:hypothetical protein
MTQSYKNNVWEVLELGGLIRWMNTSYNEE